MILLHQPVKIIDETITSVLGVLKMLTYMDRLDWANFLAHPAENATKFVDFVHDGEPVPLIILTTNQPDAVCGTNGRTKTTRYALWATVSVRLHDMRATPPRMQLSLLFRILLGDLYRVYKMLEGESHTT